MISHAGSMHAQIGQMVPVYYCLRVLVIAALLQLVLLSRINCRGDPGCDDSSLSLSLLLTCAYIHVLIYALVSR